MLIAKDWYDWAKNHAEKGPDGVWRCKETKKEIISVSIFRTITWQETGAGLEVRGVYHPYCPKCVPKPKLPKSGSPICEDQLIDENGK